MCGFLGGFFSGNSEEKIKAGLAAIRHRGPDNEGIYLHQDFFTAACRLSVQDLSDRGQQPMRSEDGRYVLSYNGELYNQKELRQQLLQKGFDFQSQSDTEVLLAAWQAWGPGCLPQLNGIFSFAIFDALEESIYLARDPLGVKPLYVYEAGASFLFASELKALLQWPGAGGTLQKELFYYYLLFLYLPGGQTLFRNLQKLPPGHWGVYKRKEKRFEVKRFYQLPFNGQYTQHVSVREWTDKLEAQLLTTVSAQLQSDAGLGFYLSGGLDSTLLAAMAKKVSGGQHFPCFTLGNLEGLKTEGFGDDFSFARLAAHHLQLDVRTVSGALHLESELDKMVWHLDEPQGDPAALHTLHLSQAAASAGLKVMISGAGADDVFSGYRRHQAMRWNFLARSPQPVKNLLASVAGLKSNALQRRVQKLLVNNGSSSEARLFAGFFWLPPQRVKQLFTGGMQEAIARMDPYQPFRQVLQEIPSEHNCLNQMLAAELRIFMGSHNLNYLDKLSMAAGIEARVPYLDKEVIAFSAQLPPGLKLKGNTTKYLLRQVAARYLPQEIIHRKKTGFAAPIRSMLTGPLSGLVQERLLEGSLRQQNIFDEKEIKKLVAANATGTVDAAYPIFTLLAIESWLRQFCPA